MSAISVKPLDEYILLTEEEMLEYQQLHHRNVPKVTFRMENRITQLYVRRQLNGIEKEGSPGLDDWACRFPLKNFEFVYCLDYAHILDDKAISTYKRHWDQVYDSALLGYTSEPGTESRRVMLEVLSRTDIFDK
uniref:RdRp catalytic domain-containing protein n=1 Tax=Trichuris muris TaxID=70415 RepID=A0A5S6QNZ0_TRIMR